MSHPGSDSAIGADEFVQVDPERLLGALDDLNAPEFAEEEIAATVGRAIMLAATVVGVTGVGLLMADANDGRLRYVASTDPLAEVLETAQEDVGEGPCVESYILDRIVSTTDARSDPRWPQLKQRLAGTEIGAVLGIPTRLGGETIGTLNAYSSRPRQWHDSQVEALKAFNELLEARLVSAAWGRREGKASALADQLQHALDSRVVVERGIGFLMGRKNLSVVAAFHLLRTIARQTRRRVADVATEILEGAEPENLLAAEDTPT